jgi:hypothetical protein
MVNGTWSKPIEGWPYIPICRECLSETLVRTGGHPVIVPSPGLPAPATLQ